MRIYLSRWVCLDVESNLRRVAEEASAAADAKAALCVFPEGFLHGYKREVAPSRVRETFGTVSRAHPGIAFCFGSFSEERRNRMTIWRGGEEIARYDKVHLFAPFNEPAIWEPGDRYAAVRLDGLTFGLVNCNDIRFPEQARALLLEAHVDVLLAVAWWPWRRDHVWRTLLRARAIENGVFAAGCCVAASEYPGERFAGAGNYVFDPLGDPVRAHDDRVYDLDRERLANLVVNPLETYVNIERVDVFP
jgi:predicted amidohydrolase